MEYLIKDNKNDKIISSASSIEELSDGYHTFNELYDFRREYNAALVNSGVWKAHKSYRHHNGELCFGGGWFIVMIDTPFGQISNHYENKYWDEFHCEEKEVADEWDGHTDKEVLNRLYHSNKNWDTLTMTRKELEGVLSEIEPYCYETNRKEYWYKKGCIDGLNATDTEPNLTSLWHDASEEPEGDCCDIIHQDENGCCWLESKADIMRLYDTWNEFTEVEMIIRWAYISDLLPKGGEK